MHGNDQWFAKCDYRYTHCLWWKSQHYFPKDRRSKFEVVHIYWYLVICLWVRILQNWRCPYSAWALSKWRLSSWFAEQGFPVRTRFSLLWLQNLGIPWFDMKLRCDWIALKGHTNLHKLKEFVYIKSTPKLYCLFHGALYVVKQKFHEFACFIGWYV